MTVGLHVGIYTIKKKESDSLFPNINWVAPFGWSFQISHLHNDSFVLQVDSFWTVTACSSGPFYEFTGEEVVCLSNVVFDRRMETDGFCPPCHVPVAQDCVHFREQANVSAKS